MAKRLNKLPVRFCISTSDGFWRKPKYQELPPFVDFRWFSLAFVDFVQGTGPAKGPRPASSTPHTTRVSRHKGRSQESNPTDPTDPTSCTMAPPVTTGDLHQQVTTRSPISGIHRYSFRVWSESNEFCKVMIFRHILAYHSSLTETWYWILRTSLSLWTQPQWDNMDRDNMDHMDGLATENTLRIPGESRSIEQGWKVERLSLRVTCLVTRQRYPCLSVSLVPVSSPWDTHPLHRLIRLGSRCGWDLPRFARFLREFSCVSCPSCPSCPVLLSNDVQWCPRDLLRLSFFCLLPALYFVWSIIFAWCWTARGLGHHCVTACYCFTIEKQKLSANYIYLLKCEQCTSNNDTTDARQNMCFLSASLHFLDFWGSLNGLSLDFWGSLSVCAQHIWLVWNSFLHCQISEVVGSLLKQLNPSCSMVAICHHHITMLTYHTCTSSPHITTITSTRVPQCGCLGCLDILHTEGLVVPRAVLHLLLFTSFNSKWENGGSKFRFARPQVGLFWNGYPTVYNFQSPHISPHIPTFT